MDDEQIIAERRKHLPGPLSDERVEFYRAEALRCFDQMHAYYPIVPEFLLSILTELQAFRAAAEGEAHE